MAADAPAAERTEQAKPVPIWERLRVWLSHPFFLLLAGAVITGLLVPYITHSWQTAQMARDTKTKAIADIADAASTALTQLEIDMNPVTNSGVAANARLNTPQNIASAFTAWTMKSTSVESELAAYFPSNAIPVHWADLAGLLKTFFLLTYAHDPSMRQQYIAGLRHYFNVHHIATGVDWSALQPDTPWTDAYMSNWKKVERQIISVKNQLIADVMDAPAPSF